MHAGNYGWIELVLFYGIAIGFGLWQYFSMDRKLKRTRAEKAAKEAAEATAKQEDAPSD
jgi:hypothetical protein